jgi:hypothetical protein
MLRKMAVGFVCFVGFGMLGLLGTSVSGAEDKKVVVTFANATDGAFELFSLDSGTAKEVSFGSVQQGKRIKVDSVPGHVWIVRGDKGRELGRYTIGDVDEEGFRLVGPQAELPKK